MKQEVKLVPQIPETWLVDVDCNQFVIDVPLLVPLELPINHAYLDASSVAVNKLRLTFRRLGFDEFVLIDIERLG